MDASLAGTAGAGGPFRLLVDARQPRESARAAAAAVPAGGVLYYALGGGLGHLTRALAIGRHFRRRTADPFLILTNCAETARIHEPADLLQLTPAPEADAPALGELVRELVAAVRPAVLAVDAFPAGILGELAPVLPSLPTRRVAVLRRLQSRWVERWGLADLLPSAYDAVALVEPGAALPGAAPGLRCVETPPVLVRDADELLSPSEVRHRLGHPGDGPLVGAVVTGARPADQGLLGVARRATLAVAPEAAVRFLTPHPGGMPAGEYAFHFPLLEWLPALDLVIGPAGYNLCHETAALGTPVVFVPQPRLYDDQWARVEGRPVARSPQELEQRIRELLPAMGITAERPRPAYPNGAADVAALLAEIAA